LNDLCHGRQQEDRLTRGDGNLMATRTSIVGSSMMAQLALVQIPIKYIQFSVKIS
jgi:hypothetical protein